MIDVFEKPPVLMTPRVINGSIVFQAHNPDQIRACIPGLKEAQGFFAAPLTLETARILRNLGIEAPSPIRTRYDWPIMNGRSPRPHQVTTSEFLTLNPRAHVHNSPRTGKTLSTLWSIDFLQRLGVVNKALVIAPLSTLERAWGDELFLNFPHKRFSVLYGSKDKRLKLLKEEAEVYIVNHDGVEIILKELMLRGDIDLVVIDELAVIRNAKTNRFKAMNALVNQRGVYTWCWGLTGTPVSNEPTDAYGQAKLVRPESVKNISFTSFKNMTMQQFGPFRWCPRKGSEEVVTRVLSPSIRFDRSVVTSMEPCLIERHAELSAEQKHHVNKLLREAVTEIDGSTVSAVNAAVLISKIVQASCIAIDTPVLSSRGWVPIQEISVSDLLWDGVEWVTHGGLVDKGTKNVVNCGGVLVTPDHELMTTAGWKTAKEINDGDAGKEFAWVTVRLPDSDSACRVLERKNKTGVMAMPLRLRQGNHPKESKSSLRTPTERKTLWLPHGDMANAWDVRNSAIQDLDAHEASVRLTSVQRLGKLRRTRYHGVQPLANIIRELLVRYGTRILARTDAWSHRQRRPVLSGELPMGNSHAAVEQQAGQRAHRNAQRENDNCPSCPRIRYAYGDASCQNFQVQLGCVDSTHCAKKTASNQVYDIKNCGPRNRFVVRGRDGELRLAHNCGVVYGADGEYLEIDFGPRLKVLEEAIIENGTGKVLVFLPFTGALNAVARELRKNWSVEVVDGSVSAGKRNTIYQDFETKKDPHVMVAHPQCMAHGISLVAADLIIWYAPITSNEIYTQACARIDGGGQKSKMDVLHISSTPTERKIYATVREKGRLQDCVLSLLKEGRVK